MRHYDTLTLNAPWLGVVLSFVGGVLAGLTPCSYPMIPITVAFVGSRAQGSRLKGFFLSAIYVSGMAMVYSALGLVAALTGRLFGSLTMNPWVYLAVGNLCLVFALIMLEVLPMPSPAFLSRVQVRHIPGRDALSSFLVGGASALVVGPCTTPILGTLLTLVATGKSAFWGALMLFAFAYGMGMLVIAVGTFTGILASLPRSGLWMRRIQRFFALVMIGAAEYFFVKAGEMWL
ncbi:MAG: cytochrome c biogenesis protein CcdA [Desulfosoma sp.]